MGSLVLLGLANPLWKWGAGIIALCFGVAALSKTFYLRLGTLRGKFHMILGAGAIILCAAIRVGLISTVPWHIFGVHYLARFIFVLSVFMMFIGLMKQGYALSVGNWVQVAVVFALVAAIGLWFSHVFYGSATMLMSILVYMSLFIMLETFAVIRVYVGSDLGRR